MKQIWLKCVLIMAAMPLLAQEGQLAHYRFERNLDDLSRNELHLTNGGGIFYSNQLFARAAFFSGATNNFATRTAAQQFGQGDFSLSLWFYPKPHEGRQFLFDSRGNDGLTSQEGIRLGIEVESNRWHLAEFTADDGDGNNYSQTFTDSWPVYNWYHLTLTYNSSTNSYIIFIDGEQQYEGSTGPLMMDEDTGFSLGASHVKPGGDPLTRSNFFRGYLDEVRLFEVTLLESEVAVLAKREALPVYIDHQVDYVQEQAGGSHQLGFYYLDIDTNGDGIPNFLQVGPDEDLDGDLIVNSEDWDDDGDNIPDELDHAGYDIRTGPQAGYAPVASNTVAAAYFINGEEAAAAGEHAGDYWQFVPNGIYEQNGQPYSQDGHTIERFYLEPAAFLYIDEYDDQGAQLADGIPDVLQKPYGASLLPPMALEKGYLTEHVSGEPFPGLLGTWNERNGETIFYLCDDDPGASVSGAYNDFSPYKIGSLPVQDESTYADGNIDYLIYGTTDEWSGQIPYVLNKFDDRGERLWRYRWLGESVSERREVVYFLTVYYGSGGSQVQTYHTKTVFNELLRYPPSRNGATTGVNYGLEPGWAYEGTPLSERWFPAFNNEADHDRLVQAVFGDGYHWRDIATFEEHPVSISPLVPQEWIDRWENMTMERAVANYINLGRSLEDVNIEPMDLMNGRYGTEYADFDSENQVIRAENQRVPHSMVKTFSEATQPGCLISWEDLYVGGDRDVNDVSFYTNIIPTVSTNHEE